MITYTGLVMARRLCGFALAVVILGAPLAPAICGVTCASHDMPGMASPSEHHACHESSSGGATAVPVPHPCGHDSDGTIAPQELLRLLVSIGVIDTPVAVVEPIDIVVIGSRATPVESSPPPRLAAITPLRV